MEADLRRLIAHLGTLPNRAVSKQLRFWGGNMRVCPFLMSDKKCFVYDVRPAVCEAYGHIKVPDYVRADMTCPYEREGKTFFEEWTPERVKAFDDKHGILASDKAIMANMLGVDILHALKNGQTLQVRYLTRDQWQEVSRSLFRSDCGQDGGK